jgi:hypothetical protein
MSASTSTDNQNVSTDSLSAADKTATHEAAVKRIVGLIQAKYEDEGDRNFRIGKEAFEHAQWQRGNFPGYEAGDFDNLMDRIRDEVRLFVAIKPKSIRIAVWVRTYVLRECVRKVVGDLADNLSHFEYAELTGKALSFDKKALEGDLVDGWADFIKRVANDRATGRRVTSDAFFEGMAEHVKHLERIKAAADPAKAAAKAASDAIKERTRAVAKVNEAITTGVSDALVNGYLSAEQVLGIVENVAKHHKVPLPTAIGFDPARCTIEECNLLASTMFQAGKYAEMVHLRDRLDKMVKAVDSARASIPMANAG